MCRKLNSVEMVQLKGKIMSKKTFVVMPQTEKILEQMGEQIKLARLRRKLSAELVAERASISRATLWSIEKGNPSVAIGKYAAVLHALNGKDVDLTLIAKDDEFRRKLQDLGLRDIIREEMTSDDARLR